MESREPKPMMQVSDQDVESRSQNVVAMYGRHLLELATVLPRGRTESIDSPGLELQSGSIVWPDEIPLHLMSPQQKQAIKTVLVYRTTLIAGSRTDELRGCWEIALSAFPDWIGFSPARLRPNLELSQRMKKELESIWEGLCDGEPGKETG